MLPLDGPPDRETPNAWIIANVGSYPGFLRRVSDERWRRVDGFHFHEIPGKGSVPCMNNGVVEPIGQAIIAAFHSRPEEMLLMAQYALEEDRFHLAWRLCTSAREVTSATNIQAATASEEAVALIDDYIRHHYDQLLHEVGEDGKQEGKSNISGPRVDDATNQDDATRSDAGRRERNRKKKARQNAKNARQKARRR
jgi:hypothetical protein